MRRAIKTLAVTMALAACWLPLAGCNGGRPRAIVLSEFPGPFTILCTTFGGPSRGEDVQKHLQALEARGMHDGYTVEDAGSTVLYYGQYKTHDAPEVKSDLDMLRRFIYGETRQKAFPLAMIVPVSMPAEEYFPLIDAPATALYSLQIATFFGPQNEGRTPQQSAVMLAKELREKEHLEAYVHQGQTSSVVCVGSFPPSAIQSDRRLPPISTDPRELVRGEVGVEDIAQMTKVVDPAASALLARFPHMYYNGGEKWTWLHRQLNAKDWIRNYQKYYFPSLFVEIPDRKVDQYGQVVIERILQ